MNSTEYFRQVINYKDIRYKEFSIYSVLLPYGYNPCIAGVAILAINETGEKKEKDIINETLDTVIEKYGREMVTGNLDIAKELSLLTIVMRCINLKMDNKFLINDKNTKYSIIHIGNEKTMNEFLYWLNLLIKYVYRKRSPMQLISSLVDGCSEETKILKDNIEALIDMDDLLIDINREFIQNTLIKFKDFLNRVSNSNSYHAVNYFIFKRQDTESIKKYNELLHRRFSSFSFDLFAPYRDYLKYH